MGIVLVFVPGGSYFMGSPADGGRYDEQPLHRVSVSDFWIGKYEVTQGQWATVMEDSRTTQRLACPPGVRSPFIGFRIAISSP
ncbi:MAG: formylglycine-generating enzyme family protein [Deferrisomatales bacterium]